MKQAPKVPQWDDLRILLAVLQAGSFSGAAEALRVEQSTISRRIARLEHEFGQALFDRQPHGPQPTELAERMRLHAERAAAAVQAIRDLATGEEDIVRGRVLLALTESFAVHVFVPHLLRELRDLYPDLAVDIVASSAPADLNRREADLAVRFFRPTRGDISALRVASLPTAVLAHRSYANTHPMGTAALDWIVLDLGNGTSVDARFVEEHVSRPPVMMTNSHLVQVESVRAGMGVALLARAHLLLDPELVSLDLDLPPLPPVEVWLAAPSALRRVPRVRAVWDFLSEKLRALESA